MVNVLLPCCQQDQNQAIWLLEWITQLGKVDTNCFLLCAKDCEVARLTELGNKAFTRFKWVEDAENIKSDWKVAEISEKKSASGPNSLFRQAIWIFASKNLGPWLFLEPDAIPCRADWLELITKEYEGCGKPFLGFLIDKVSHPGPVAPHMSGVAVYPGNSPAYFRSQAARLGHVAFDIQLAEVILPRMSASRTIFHRFRPPPFTTQEDFDQRVPQSLALYHACKDGSIYPFLRKRVGLQEVETPEQARAILKDLIKTEPKGSFPVSRLISDDEFRKAGLGAPTVDIFIKTRVHDYPWLEWCLKSINKFTNGFLGTIVQSPDPLPTLDFIESQVRTDKHEHEQDKEPGYLWQQRCKLYADTYSKADYILFMDSDCVFTRPVTPDDFIKDGKVIWQYTPRDLSREDQHVWYPVMEKFLGKKPEHEFMRRHPFCVPRWAFEELRTFCKYKHGKSLEEYIMGEADPNNGLALKFSEWNCLGFFLWEHHRDRVHWVTDSEASPSCIYQGFTHGGEQRKQEDIAKFKELLGSPSGDAGSSTPDVQAPSLTIASAIAFLASQATSNPIKGQIVRDLKKAWKATNTRIAGGGREKLGKITVGTHITVGNQKPSTLLCIHSYPGANETVKRHWGSYKAGGFDKIIGIGTTDGRCEWPDDIDSWAAIGENYYMKFKGPDDHLCRRLLDTVQYCMAQPQDHFVICEYDTIFLRKFPKFSGVCAHHTGGRINGSKTSVFRHNPWAFDRESGPKLIDALEKALPHSQEYPNNSPDLFFGLACERAGIEVKCNFKMFTRNTLDHDLDLACQAVRDGAHVVHGCKTEAQYSALMDALNESGLLLSKTA